MRFDRFAIFFFDGKRRAHFVSKGIVCRDEGKIPPTADVLRLFPVLSALCRSVFLVCFWVDPKKNQKKGTEGDS